MDFTRNTSSYAYHDGCLHVFYVDGIEMHLLVVHNMGGQ